MLIPQPNEILGQLAAEFRGTQDPELRQRIVEQYAAQVDLYITAMKEGFAMRWKEVPAYEDRLPRDLMPQSFYDYWKERAENDAPRS